MLQEVPGDGAVPEFVEAGGEARQGGFEVFADLTIERSAFADQVAAMAGQELQGGPSFIAGGFEEGTAGNGGAVHGGQVGVVGFVARVDGLAILFSDEGVYNTGLKTSRSEGALDEAMIAAGAFDGDEAILELKGSKGLADLVHGGLEVGPVVVDPGGRDEDAAVEIGQEEFGADFGGVKADDAKVFRSDLLDPGMELALRFAEVG